MLEQRRLRRGLPRVGTRATVGMILTGSEDYAEPILRPASPEEAEGLPAFGRGVELLASAIAGTTWYAYRGDSDNGVWQRLPDQPQIVTDPDPSTTDWHWKYSAAVDLVEYGNHVSLLGDVDWQTQRAGWLLPLPIDQVSLVTDVTRPGLWAWSVAGELLDPSEVLHISAGNRSGEILGRGVVRQYADSLGQAVAAERYSGKWFAGGGLPPGIIQTPVQPSQAQLEDLKSKWRLLSVTGEPMALPPNVTVTPLAQDADRAQLVESRTWNAQLTAMLLGIPAYKLGLPGTSMTYSNVESVDIEWTRDSVDRWGQPIARCFSKYLLPRGQGLRFDWASRMRTDTGAQAQYLSAFTRAGIMTIDEARARVGLPPLMATLDQGTTPVGVPELTPQEVTG